jgi:hypothetical protein
VIDLSALEPFVVLMVLITIPAIIVFSVMTYLRVRKSSFRRHRSGTRTRSESESSS